MTPAELLDFEIKLCWKKKATNASEAYFRAEEITRLQKLKLKVK